MLSEYDVVLAKRNLSQLVHLGCKGAILICHGNDTYEVEFVDDDGDSLEVLTVSGVDLSAVDKKTS